MGSIRIYSNVPDNLPNVAYLTPTCKKVLIALNESNKQVTFDIQFSNKRVIPNFATGSLATYTLQPDYKKIKK